MSTIEYYVPGILISFNLPIQQFNETNKKTSSIEIDIKNEFHELFKKYILSHEFTQNNSNLHDGDINGSDDNIHTMETISYTNPNFVINKSNRHQKVNIVEKLERKFSNLCTAKAIEFVDASDDDSVVGIDATQELNDPQEDVIISQPQNQNKKVKSKKRKRIEHEFYDTNDPFIDDSEVCEEIETMVKMSMKTKKNGFFVNWGDLEIIDEADSEEEFDQYDSDNEKSGIKVTRTKAPKAQWNPTSEILEILEIFKTKSSQLLSKPLPKNATVPRELHSSLLECHLNVIEKYSILSNHSNQEETIKYMNKVSGYYEGIVNILGGLIPVGRIKRILFQLFTKNKADSIKMQLDAHVHALKEFISHNISLISHKPKTIPKDPINLDTQSNETTILFANTSEDEVKVKTKTNNDADNFKWKCKWDSNMRGILVAVDDYISHYVELENSYRLTLTTSDMKELSDSECDELSRKDIQLEIFRDIITAFPPDCQSADINSLRGRLSSERGAQKKAMTSDNVDKPDKTNDSATSSDLPVEMQDISTHDQQMTQEDPKNNSMKASKPRGELVLTVPSNLSHWKTFIDQPIELTLPKKKKVKIALGSSLQQTNDMNQSITSSQSIKSKQLVWEPNEECKQALEEFKQAFSLSGLKSLSKSSPIPHVLDNSLLNLHQTFKEKYLEASNPLKKDGSWIKKLIGYYEAIAEILGGQIPSGRVKFAILHLEYKEKASKLYSKLQQTIYEVKRSLRSLISKAPTTEQLLPPLSTSQEETSNDDKSKQVVQGILDEVVAAVENGKNFYSKCFLWRCSWSQIARSQCLVAIELAEEWMEMENNVRKTYTSNDKLCLEDSEVN